MIMITVSTLEATTDDHNQRKGTDDDEIHSLEEKFGGEDGPNK